MCLVFHWHSFIAFSNQASSSESMGRWLGVLLAETGSTTDPAALHYDYIDVETTANVIQLAKQSFWWESLHNWKYFYYHANYFFLTAYPF